MPDAINGLSSREAQRRLREFGLNVMPEAPAMPLWRRAARQFQSPLIYLLMIALAFDLGIWISDGAVTWPIEAIAIFAILILNAGLSTLPEYRSEQALAKLKELATPMAWVCRDGRFERIPGSRIFPGDVVRVGAGERIPADGKLLDGSGVMVDESVLTGESLPVEKEPGDELFSGTLMVRAGGQLGVLSTGPSRSMGRLATMLGSIRTEATRWSSVCGSSGSGLHWGSAAWRWCWRSWACSPRALPALPNLSCSRSPWRSPPCPRACRRW